MEELWTLLHFLQPSKFSDLEAFQVSFDTLEKEHQIARLPQLLAPHLLRRARRVTPRRRRPQSDHRRYGLPVRTEPEHLRRAEW